MTIDDVKAKIDAIHRNTGDDERQHAIEDALWLEVLTAIASGATNGHDLAREAGAEQHFIEEAVVRHVME